MGEGDFPVFRDVDFNDHRLGILRDLFDNWSQQLAWATPVGVELNKDDFVFVYGLIELRPVIDMEGLGRGGGSPITTQPRRIRLR